MNRSRSARVFSAAVLAGLIAVVLSGCIGIGPWSSGDDRARDFVSRQALDISRSLDRELLLDTEASDIAYNNSTEQYENTGMLIEAMAWEGNTRDDGGAVFTLRITASVSENRGTMGDWSTYDAGSWSACYAYKVLDYTKFVDTEFGEVDCPEKADRLPGPQLMPQLPDDALSRLDAVLASSTDASIAEELAAAFPESAFLHLRPSHSISRVSDSQDGDLAAAVGIIGTTECVVGTRNTAGSIAVWHPSDVSVAPGEIGCTIASARTPIVTH